MPQIDRCKSCQAEVYWLHHIRTGARAPITVQEYDDGNVRVDLERGTWSVVSVQSEGLFGRESLRYNHFANCPDSKRWKR